MPKRKRQNKKRVRKGVKKNGNRKIATFATRGSLQTVFPDKFVTKLVSYAELVPNWAATAAITYRYLATSVFAPDPTSAMAQPQYFDQLALIYASYRVHRSRITVRVASGVAGVIPQLVTVLPLNADPGATPFTNYLQAPLFPYSKSRTLSPYGGPPILIKSSMTTQRIFGSQMVKWDDNFAALVSASPVNNWYWGVVIYQNTALTATAPYYITIKIEFDVEFYDRKAVVDAISNRTPPVSIFVDGSGNSRSVITF